MRQPPSFLTVELTYILHHRRAERGALCADGLFGSPPRPPRHLYRSACRLATLRKARQGSCSCSTVVMRHLDADAGRHHGVLMVAGGGTGCRNIYICCCGAPQVD